MLRKDQQEAMYENPPAALKLGGDRLTPSRAQEKKAETEWPEKV